MSYITPERAWIAAAVVGIFFQIEFKRQQLNASRSTAHAISNQIISLAVLTPRDPRIESSHPAPTRYVLYADVHVNNAAPSDVISGFEFHGGRFGCVSGALSNRRSTHHENAPSPWVPVV